MAAPVSSYRPEYCDIAIKVLADGESLAAVCCELDICRTTLYEWRDKHPDFARALRKGLQKAQRDWETLGRHGVNGDIDKFSATAWLFTMKNRFRDDYAEDKKEDKKSDEKSVLEKIISGEIVINKPAS
jgi:hypothetical protein